MKENTSGSNADVNLNQIESVVFLTSRLADENPGAVQQEGMVSVFSTVLQVAMFRFSLCVWWWGGRCTVRTW